MSVDCENTTGLIQKAAMFVQNGRRVAKNDADVSLFTYTK